MRIYIHIYTHKLYLLQTYHCRTPKKIPVSRMDPSCTLGFYCHTLEDFKLFRKQAEKVRHNLIK